MVDFPSVNPYACKRTDGRKERNINNSKSSGHIRARYCERVVVSNILFLYCSNMTLKVTHWGNKADFSKEP